MQDLSLYLGQQECYESASTTLEYLLHVKVNGMQIQRQVMKYGSEIEEVLHQPTPCVELKENEKVYAMMDGAMILTRKLGWKEVKLGRVFTEKSLHIESEKRNWIRSSEYVGHLGDHKSFENKFSLIVDKYECLKSNLVFINDGARWIWNYIDAEFPNSTQILDYYHAVEHLSSFAKLYFFKKETKEYRGWFEQIKRLLKEKGIDSVLKEIKELKQKTPTVEQERAKLIAYCEKNKKRMDYPKFIKQGLLIGSGAIEAAHRNVTQKRLKLSGQRWSIDGAQNIINLRTLNMSGRWNCIHSKLRNTA